MSNYENKQQEREIVILSGTIKKEIIKSVDRNGKDFYFTFLENKSDNDGDIVVFFFNPSDDEQKGKLRSRIENLQVGDNVKLRGYYSINNNSFNKNVRFTAEDLID